MKITKNIQSLIGYFLVEVVGVAPASNWLKTYYLQV